MTDIKAGWLLIALGQELNASTNYLSDLTPKQIEKMDAFFNYYIHHWGPLRNIISWGRPGSDINWLTTAILNYDVLEVNLILPTSIEQHEQQYYQDLTSAQQAYWYHRWQWLLDLKRLVITTIPANTLNQQTENLILAANKYSSHFYELYNLPLPWMLVVWEEIVSASDYNLDLALQSGGGIKSLQLDSPDSGQNLN